MGPFQTQDKAEAELQKWNDFIATNPSYFEKKHYIDKSRSETGLIYNYINYEDNPAALVERFMLKWVEDNYGPSEAEDPCYNMTELSEYLYEKFNFKRRNYHDEQRDTIPATSGETT